MLSFAGAVAGHQRRCHRLGSIDGCGLVGNDGADHLWPARFGIGLNLSNAR